MKQPCWYHLVFFVGLLISSADVKTMHISSVPDIIEEPEEIVQSTRHHPRALEHPAPGMNLHQALPTIPERSESPALFSQPNAESSSSMTAGPSHLSGAKPPQAPRHRRTGAVDLGHASVPRHIQRHMPRQAIPSPRITLTVNNKRPSAVTVRRIYTSEIIPGGLPPLQPVHKENRLASGQRSIQVRQFMRRGKKETQQTLMLTTVQFIDPRTEAVIRELSAIDLAQPALLANIILENPAPIVNANRPPRSPHPRTGLGRHAQRGEADELAQPLTQPSPGIK